MESEAWRQDLKRNLRVIHCERQYEAQARKHEWKQLRVVTSAPIDILRSGQGWKVGRLRIPTRNYSLEHNSHHNVSAIVGFLAMRSFGRAFTLAYWHYATARPRNALRRFVKWFEDVVIEDWVRYLDRALVNADITQG